MTSITWAGPRCVQELATILAPQNRIQGFCVELCSIPAPAGKVNIPEIKR